MFLVVAHQKGGVGKSTIAWNLTIALQKKKYDIELLDLDVQQTLYFANEIRKKDTDLKPLVVKRIESIDDLKLYIEADSDEKLTVVDIGGFDSDMARVAIASADMILTPVSHKNFELLGIRTFEKMLISISETIGDNVVAQVVLNNLNPSKTKLEDLKEFIDRSEHFHLLDTILRSRADYDRSAGVGKNVIEYDKKSKAGDEIKSLTKEVINILCI